MVYYNNALAIEARWMIDEGIFSEANYKQLTCVRKQLKVVRPGCNGHPALVDYESMPERFKRAVCAKVGNPYDAVRVNRVESHIRHDSGISGYFDTFRLADGRFLPKKNRMEYYTNAIVLEALHELLCDRSSRRAALGSKTTGAWDTLAEAVQELDRTRYPHTLPANPRRLESKYKKYRTEGYKSLIHSNFLNRNAASVDTDEKEAFIIELLSHSNNLDNSQIAGLYNMMADKMGWKTIARGTVAKLRDKYELETYAGRRGTSAFYNTKAMQVKRRAPQYPLCYWTLDGWDVELLYQKTTTDPKGHSVTMYHERPTVVVVLDACCKYPVGYAVGTHETPQLIMAALRNAARHTAELFGTMYRTAQIQSDRYAIKAMTPLYTNMAKYFTPARVKNAKSKIIEPYFNEINRKHCQLQPNWSGFGIASGRDRQPNAEALNLRRKDFPDFEGVCRQVCVVMEREREAKRAAYVSLFAEMPVEHKTELPLEQYLMLFGETTGHRSLLQSSGLHATVGGVRRTFDCFDTEFRRHASVRWEVRYDPDDPSRALAVSEDESLRFLLEEKYVQPMALAERRPGDHEQLQRVQDYNDRLTEHVIEVRARSGEATRALLRGHPELDTLQKLLIVDSHGQHKDRRNDRRALAPPGQTAEEDGFFDKY